MAALPAVKKEEIKPIIEPLGVEYVNAKDKFFNSKIRNIQTYHNQIKEGFLFANYVDSGNVEKLKQNDILLIEPIKKVPFDGAICLFEFRGHILVRELQIMPFGNNKEIKKSGYRSVCSRFEEFFIREEIQAIGLIVGKITPLHITRFFKD